MDALLEPAPRVRLGYEQIPGVPSPAVAGHVGELLIGMTGGRAVLVLSGRVHPYEGYSQREVTVLLRACFDLGVRSVLLTNAAGALDPDFQPGDVMLLTDSINLSGDNPLIGPNLDRLGPRFVPMADAFDTRLGTLAREAAERAGIPLREGVYVMLSGPNYETRAEMRMLRRLGADAVGMSTVPEVLVARHAGVRVLALSLITNQATPEVDHEVTHDEVLEVGRAGAAKIVRLLAQLLPEID